MVSRPQNNNTFNFRSSLVTAFLFLVFAVIIFRLFSLQVISGKKTRVLAEAQHSIYRKLFPVRGEIKIIDRYTLESASLATNIKKYLVYAVPQEVQNPSLTAASLATELNLDSKELAAKISQSEKKYVPLKRQLTDQEQEKIKKLELPGIYFDAEGTRLYPEKSLLSQTLGFVGYKGDAKAGLYGLERYFEKELAGTSGSLREEKDTAGAWIFGSTRDIEPATDGVNLILTIDKTLQFKAESILKEAVEKNDADSGSIIVVDPKTGAVLAMASFPDFDPNEYGKVPDPKIYTNEAVTGNYEPGSVFKPITMAAAINEDKVGPDTTYVDPGEIKIDDYTIKNSDNKAHGTQTMTQVLDESLNTGAIFAKEQIGNPKFLEYIKKFGFGQSTGIELPETKGNLDNLKGNIGVNFHTASFGQGISVTPIQLVQAFTAFANGGKMKPYLVQAKVYPGGRTENTSPKEVAKVISEKTANIISAMLVSVVENGHGKRAAVPGYYIAGKTGTAQVPKANGKGYEENNNIGSFIGYGPATDPQFVMLVRINHPRTVKFAENTAAPAFGQMAQFIVNYLHIAPARNEQN